MTSFRHSVELVPKLYSLSSMNFSSFYIIGYFIYHRVFLSFLVVFYFFQPLPLTKKLVMACKSFLYFIRWRWLVGWWWSGYFACLFSSEKILNDDFFFLPGVVSAIFLFFFIYFYSFHTIPEITTLFPSDIFLQRVLV